MYSLGTEFTLPVKDLPSMYGMHVNVLYTAFLICLLKSWALAHIANTTLKYGCQVEEIGVKCLPSRIAQISSPGDYMLAIGLLGHIHQQNRQRRHQLRFLLFTP